MPTITYQSIVEFPGDGITVNWDFNFAGGYISRAHVRAWVQAPDGTITDFPITDSNFVTDFRLNVAPAVPVGSVLRIYRETPRDLPLVDFEGGSNFTPANLDLLAKQAIFCAAEAFDTGAYITAVDLLGQASAALEAAETLLTTVQSAEATTAAAAAQASTNSAAAVAAAASAQANATTIGNFAALAASLQVQIANVAGSFNFRGNWTTATAYSAGAIGNPGTPRDLVKGPVGSPEQNLSYVVMVSHTSGTFATDLAAGRLLNTDAAQLAADLNTGGPGRGSELVKNRRTDLAGAEESSLGFHIRSDLINIARDFNLSPGADITTALQTAIADGRRWYLRGTPAGAGNDWLVSANIPLNSNDIHGYGDGRTATRIRATHSAGHIFTWGTGPYVIVQLSGMRLTSINTGSPLYFPYDATKMMYGSTLRDLQCLAVDGNGVHLGAEFSTALKNVWAQSQTMHSFFLQGGNTTLLEHCYAFGCGPDKAGYRILGTAQLNSCNAINFGGSIYRLGAASATGGAADANDPYTGNSIANVQLINCNMENFTKYAIRGSFQGYVSIMGGKIAPNTTSYVAFTRFDGPWEVRLFGRPRIDAAGVRVAWPEDGVPAALSADWSRQFTNVVYTSDDDYGFQMSVDTGTPTPFRTHASRGTAVTGMTFRGSTTAGSSVCASSIQRQQQGDSVRLHGRIILTTKDPAMAGNVRIGPLPVLPNASVGLAGSGIVGRANLISLTGANTQFFVEVTSGTDYFTLLQRGPSGSAQAVPVSSLAEGAELAFDLTYMLAP